MRALWGVMLALVVLAAGCGKRTRQAPPAPPPAQAGTSGVTIHGTKYRVVFPDHGPRVWVAEADAITAEADSGRMEMRGITCQLYRNGRQALTVRADRGQAALRDAAVEVSLTGQVRADDVQRRVRLTADTFAWSSREDRISATNTRWLGEGFTHRADRAVLSTDLTQAVFTGHVQTTATRP